MIFITSARHASIETLGVPGAAHVARPFAPHLLIMIRRALAAERAWRLPDNQAGASQAVCRRGVNQAIVAGRPVALTAGRADPG